MFLDVVTYTYLQKWVLYLLIYCQEQGNESIKVFIDYRHILPNKQVNMKDKLNKDGEKMKVL